MTSLNIKVLNEQELMKAYVEGRYEAFEELYLRSSSKVYGYIRSKIKDKNMADEVLQEVYLKLHNSRDRYQYPLPFMPWIFAITKNEIVNFYRKNKIQIAQTKLDDNILFSTNSETTECSDLLKQLSDKEKELLILHYIKGYSYLDIAKNLNLSLTNARKISSRAISKLRTIWAKQNEQ